MPNPWFEVANESMVAKKNRLRNGDHASGLGPIPEDEAEQYYSASPGDDGQEEPLSGHSGHHHEQNPGLNDGDDRELASGGLNSGNSLFWFQ